MYPVTQPYKDAIYTDERRIIGRVTFDISDVTAAEDVASITTSTELATLSQKAQLNNNERNATWNLATLEQDRFRLDGSFSFPDDVTPANNGEVGYISSALCDAAGVFSTPQTITIVFNGDHSSAGLTITFDQFNDEYATDYTVTALTAADAVIDTVTVTGNDKALVVPLGQLLNYRKIVISISKWNVGNRRARVFEVDFGIVEVYTDDSLISFNMIEEMDITSAVLPSPEFRFTVDNSERLFNILNPTGFYKYLQQRQQVIAELGIPVNGGWIEYIRLGNYLLWDWTSEEGALTASFTARTNLDLMANEPYEQLTASSKSLGALAEQIFAACGITNYSIDSALYSITTNSMAEKTDCRTLLQMIAIAGQCNLFVTRGNVITLKRVSFGAAADRIDFDNAYAEPKIELERITKQVEVTYFTNLTTSAIVTVTAPGVDLGDTHKLEKNTLINNSTVATNVANWILAQKQYRAKYSMNWRGNPAHELSDVIDIENSYGDDTSAMVTKTDLTYQGYLQARTEAHGGVN